MTVSLIDVSRPTLDAATGGLSFFVNCFRCGGALVLEAGTRGRADVVGPCMNVSQVTYCRSCGSRDRIDVVITPLNEKRSPERRWT